MPLYEYQCSQCGRFEIIRKFSDEPLTACPTCGRDINKLPSAPAFQFKGTGWYVTDYAKKSGGSDGSSKSSSSGDSGSKSSSDGGKESSSGSKDATSTPTTSTSNDSSAKSSSPSK